MTQETQTMFNVGDRVEWDSGFLGGLEVIGTVKDVDNRYVYVTSDTGQKWIVAPHILRKPE
jgi:hypothetical protein